MSSSGRLTLTFIPWSYRRYDQGRTWLSGLMSGSPSTVNLLGRDRCTSLRASQARPLRRRRPRMRLSRESSGRRQRPCHSEPLIAACLTRIGTTTSAPPEMLTIGLRIIAGTPRWISHVSAGLLWITRCITCGFLCTTGPALASRCGRPGPKGSSGSWPLCGGVEQSVDWPPPKNLGTGSVDPARRHLAQLVVRHRLIQREARGDLPEVPRYQPSWTATPHAQYSG